MVSGYLKATLPIFIPSPLSSPRFVRKSSHFLYQTQPRALLLTFYNLLSNMFRHLEDFYPTTVDKRAIIGLILRDDGSPQPFQVFYYIFFLHHQNDSASEKLDNNIYFSKSLCRVTYCKTGGSLVFVCCFPESPSVITARCRQPFPPLLSLSLVEVQR